MFFYADYSPISLTLIINLNDQTQVQQFKEKKQINKQLMDRALEIKAPIPFQYNNTLLQRAE